MQNQQERRDDTDSGRDPDSELLDPKDFNWKQLIADIIRLLELSGCSDIVDDHSVRLFRRPQNPDFTMAERNSADLDAIQALLPWIQNTYGQFPSYLSVDHRNLLNRLLELAIDRLPAEVTKLQSVVADDLAVLKSFEDRFDKPPVRLGGLRDSPVVRGTVKRPLTAPRHAVVAALVRAYPKGLTKDELVLDSGRDGAVDILKRLVKSDEDWAAVIQLPGGNYSGGYRLSYPTQPVSH